MVDKKILDKIVWDSWSKNKTADIKPSGLDFVMDTMPFKARFKHSVQDEKPFLYEAEDKSISFKPTGMWWTTPQGSTAVRAVTPSIGSLTEGKVKYPSALGTDIDIVLSTETTRWRKEIIIKSLQSLGAIPADAEYLEIGFEIETDFEIESWDKQSELKFNRAIRLSELSQLESIKTWDNHIIPEPKEDEEPEDPFERCDGFLREKDGKYFLVKRIPAEYLRDAVYPVTTDIEIAFGSEYVFNPVLTDNIHVAGLDDTHFVVVFEDEAGSNYGIAMIGTVSSGDVIAYGSEYTFNTAESTYMAVASLDDTHFVVLYRDKGGDSYGHCKIGVVSSGDVIAFGSEYRFNADWIADTSVTALDSTHFVVAFRDWEGSDYGIARVGVVSSGDVIDYGTEQIFLSASTREIHVSALDPTHFVVGFRDVNGFGGEARIGVVTGDAIAYGAPQNFSGSLDTAEVSIAALDSSHFVAAWRHNTGRGRARIGVVTGNVIAFGGEYTFNDAMTDLLFVAALDSTHFVVTFQDTGGPDYGIAMIGVVTGDVIAFGAEYEFNAAITRNISCYALDATHFVVTFEDYGGDTYGIAMIGEIPFTEKKSPGMAIRMMGAGLM